MPLNAACGVYYARHLTYIFGMFPVFMIFSKCLYVGFSFWLS